MIAGADTARTAHRWDTDGRSGTQKNELAANIGTDGLHG
jgi:hypothetical protein